MTRKGFDRPLRNQGFFIVSFFRGYFLMIVPDEDDDVDAVVQRC